MEFFLFFILLVDFDSFIFGLYDYCRFLFGFLVFIFYKVFEIIFEMEIFLFFFYIKELKEVLLF